MNGSTMCDMLTIAAGQIRRAWRNRLWKMAENDGSVYCAARVPGNGRIVDHGMIESISTSDFVARLVLGIRRSWSHE